MKNLLRLLPFLGIAIVFKACTSEPIDESLQLNLSAQSPPPGPCVDELPKTRLINNGTVAFDLQVINEDDIAEITITGINPGVTTAWNEFQAGEVLFSVTNSQPMTSDEKVVILMNTCMGYEIVIDSNNQITSYDPITF